MEIAKDIYYVGVNDNKLDLFEGKYIVPDGMAYNSYVVKGEKIAVIDSVEKGFTDIWFDNISSVIGGAEPDYLVVHHMEPDHSSSIVSFMERFPGAKIAASARAFAFMKNFYKNEFEDRRVVLAEGSELDLGGHKLTFIAAPMVHWPEVMMSYEQSEKVLFSADAFGKFGSLDSIDDEGWACEARRYYFGIVGKYGTQVQAVLKKIKDKEISAICPLHGPVLNENLDYYLNLYNTWSSYGVESEGVAIAYTSVYGHTKEAVMKLADKLAELGCPKVAVSDLARDDMAEVVEDAFRYGRIVLATTTYNGEIFPFMKQFIDELKERNFQNRKIGIIENGTWAPMPVKIIKEMFSSSKNIEFTETSVRINSALDEESLKAIDALAEEILK